MEMQESIQDESNNSIDVGPVIGFLLILGCTMVVVKVLVDVLRPYL
jgi:hypothetical protein